jgi:hypothetical protein
VIMGVDVPAPLSSRPARSVAFEGHCRDGCCMSGRRR